MLDVRNGHERTSIPVEEYNSRRTWDEQKRAHVILTVKASRAPQRVVREGRYVSVNLHPVVVLFKKAFNA